MASDGKTLVARVQSGDPAAFTSLVERYQPIVYRWSIGLVYDRDEAEDVMQEVFVLAYRKMGTFGGHGSIEGWLYRITSRVAGKHRRKHMRRSLLHDLPAARPSREVYTTDPGGRVDREQALALIRESAAALSHRQREVFDLVDLQGYSPVEAGEMLALKPVSVRANLFKARASVRRAILSVHPRFLELQR
ncbi:MAG TPA: RNA polymerase sigma factor [Gemmatimonadaceae bacterium]|jgi:RNA polymerase sigma-70 factor (ECF subfamily)